MDSINKQENYKDLQGAEAINQIKELVEGAKTCFFCTDLKTGKPFSARGMAVQKVDDQGNVWFLSAKDSDKNRHIQSDPFVQLLFQGSANSDFMTLYGQATISTDKAKIKELWTPIAKVWFTEGEDDPRISAIKVSPSEGYYWTTKNGMIVSMVKMIAGAIAGKTMDDSIEGQLQL